MTNLRASLHSAYSFVRSVETNKATASLTLDHMLQEQIDSLKKGTSRHILDARGESAAQRPSRWDVLDELERNVDQAVDAVINAGDDPDALAELGIFEAGAESREDDEPSWGAQEFR